jgi:RHS repeat-associated protein
VKQVSYSGGTVSTPGISYTYDTGTNGIGHLSATAVSGGTTTSYTAFDPMGRVQAHTQQTTTGHTYTFSYGYDLAGNLVSETYPSGRVIQTSYDGMDRPAAVNGQWQGTSATYVWNTYYNLASNLTQLSFGDNAYRFFTYNQRLQLQEVQDAPNSWSTLPEDCGYTPNGGFGYNLDLKLFWGGNQTQTTANNGSLRSATMGSCAAPLQATSFSQQYGYDSVNRLTSMTDSGGAGSAQAFSYDAYGNMWSNTTGTLPVNTGTPTTNVYNGANQLTTASYDLAGNQTSLPSYCSSCLSFDGENHLVSYAGPTPATYTYDAAGNRVTKKVGSTTTVYVYDAFNSLIAEYSSNATAPVTACDRCYVSWDHLGSTRMVTDVNGNTVSFHDFEPFGGEIAAGYAGRGSAWGATADNVIEKFTGQVRDSESGLDYFNARYFASALGRFTSPDPGNAGANLSDPQTWNGYAYVRNNPLNATDPSGYCDVLAAGITMYPGKSSVVDDFIADKLAVFPYTGSGLSQFVQAFTDGGDVPGLLLAIRGAIGQTPPSEMVNIFTISGGAQTARSALGQLSSDELARIGNITYMIPGDNFWDGALPSGNVSTTYIRGTGQDRLVPSVRPASGSYDFIQSSCGHSADCILSSFSQLLKNKSGSKCGTPGVITPTSILLPPKGTATSTIHYGAGGSWLGYGGGVNSIWSVFGSSTSISEGGESGNSPQLTRKDDY